MGDTIEVLVTVRQFVSIVSSQFAVNWVPTDLQYIKYSTAGAVLTGQNFGVNGTPQGILRTGWSDFNATGVTVPDDALLFRMYFKVLTPNAGFYPVKINPDDYPTTYEVYNSNSNQLPMSHVVGGARVNMPSDFVLDALCVNPPACNGNAGNQQASVSGGIPPYQYHWTGPNGFTSADSLLNALTPGRYDLSITDAAGNEVQAITRFFSGVSLVFANVSTESSKCNLANGCAHVNAYSGVPPYTYAWSQPGSTSNSRCDLFSGNQSVTVTDAAGCIVVRDFRVEKDSLLEVELTPSFGDCRFHQLGGASLNTDGTAPFQYHWSNGTTGSNLEQVHPNTYSVTVTDAEGCKGTASTLIKDYGTFDWDFYMFSNCDPDTRLNNVKLYGYALAQRTNPPLSISWSSGTRQEIKDLNESLVYETLSYFSNVPNGLYSVTITDADGCSQTETLVANCAKETTVDTLSPLFYLKSYTTDGCTEVRAKGLKGIKKLGFSLTWRNDLIHLDELIWQGSFLSNVNPSNFTQYPNDGRIDFAWTSPWNEGHYNDSDIRLFKVCFTDNQWDSPWVDFGETIGTPIVVEHATEGMKPFIGRSGIAYFDSPWGGIEEIPEFNLSAASCAYDGYRRIQLLSTDPDNNPYAETIYGSLHYSSPKLSPNDLLFAKPGPMSIRASGVGSFYVNIPPYSLPATECVWPGDADNNSEVNHFDLLYLGLGIGSQATPRAESDSLWQGCDAQDWPQNTPAHQVNFKNMDLDGNGLVEPADTATLLRHWGQTIDPYDVMESYRMPYPADTLNEAIRIDILGDTLLAGTSIKIPFELTAEGISGLAFSVSYDSVLVVSEARFVPANSWLGDPQSDLICVQKDFQNQSRLDIALSRTDGQFSSGAGTIGHLALTFKALPPDSLLNTLLFAAHALALGPSEKLVALGETRQEMVLRGQPNSATHTAILPNDAILLSPNPATDLLSLESLVSPISRVEISSLDGSLHEVSEFGNPAQRIQIGLEKMPAGSYFARVFCSEGVVVKKFVVAR